MKIDVQTIPHNEQRYLTSGDWFWDERGLHIRISRMTDGRYELCLAIHEIVEAMLCYYAGVPQRAADEFDTPYEQAHARGDPHYPCGCPRERLSMPGDDIHAPYRKQHQIADMFDYMLAAIMGLDRDDYDNQVDKPTP